MLANLTPLVVLLTILLLLWTAINVGRARGKFGIRAPATSGHPDFDRAFRVQMNTLEGTVAFLPALMLCSFAYPTIAGIAGLVWVFGRVLFALGYYAAAEKRELGFIVSFAALAVLTLAGGWGVIRTLLATA